MDLQRSPSQITLSREKKNDNDLVIMDINDFMENKTSGEITRIKVQFVQKMASCLLF